VRSTLGVHKYFAHSQIATERQAINTQYFSTRFIEIEYASPLKQSGVGVEKVTEISGCDLAKAC